MKKLIVAIVILLPMALFAQSNSSNKPNNCTYRAEGPDPFTGKQRRYSMWFSISGAEQPIVNAQLEQNGDEYFLRLALCPARFPQNYSGYNSMDSSDKNIIQVKFDTGEIISFDFLENQSQKSSAIEYYKYSVVEAETCYFPVYSVSREQLELLMTKKMTKIRVYYKKGFFCDTNTDVFTIKDINKTAACMLQ